MLLCIEISNEISSFVNDTDDVMSADSFLEGAMMLNKPQECSKEVSQPSQKNELKVAQQVTCEYSNI